MNRTEIVLRTLFNCTSLSVVSDSQFPYFGGHSGREYNFATVGLVRGFFALSPEVRRTQTVTLAESDIWVANNVCFLYVSSA